MGFEGYTEQGQGICFLWRICIQYSVTSPLRRKLWISVAVKQEGNQRGALKLSSLEKSHVPSILHLNRPHKGWQTNQIKILRLI